MSWEAPLTSSTFLAACISRVYRLLLCLSDFLILGENVHYFLSQMNYFSSVDKMSARSQVFFCLDNSYSSTNLLTGFLIILTLSKL